MKARLRVLAALLALFGLSAYFAESVMAAWCMPGAEAHAVTPVEDTSPAGHAGVHHGGPASDSPGSETTPPGAPPCPFDMTGAGTSCVSAPLPATAQAMRGAPIVRASLLLPLVQSPDLLLVTAHFRPPRA
jgi:hypothetical protein